MAKRAGKTKKRKTSKKAKTRPTRQRAATQPVQETPTLKGWRNQALLRRAYARDFHLRAEISRLKEMEKKAGLRRSPILELAATNVFAERAQYFSSRRGQIYAIVGGFLVLLILGLIGALLYSVFFEIYPRKPASITKWEWPDATVWIVQTVTVVATAFAGIYFLVSLCRAFLHEATSIFERRNALRFGHMFVYLKLAGVTKPKDLMKLKEDLAPLEMAGAFGWKPEASTAFKDINPADMTGGVFGRLQEIARTKLGVG
jgi:hypothetical protein